MRWIDDSVDINFELPRDIMLIAEECEYMNETENYGYDNYAEMLSDMCKEAYRIGNMTKEQWDLMERRYIYGQYLRDN